MKHVRQNPHLESLREKIPSKQTVKEVLKEKSMRNELRKTDIKNIKKILRADSRRIFSSVICLVMLFGLCVVPCLYAWFNIFSNWDPYGEDSTSRIRVAVATVDEGYNLLGLDLNMGDTVVEALKSNGAIGWQFYDTVDEALEHVYSGDCYAALIIPESFTEDIASFLTLKFEHPQLLYYENDKKNAIAPKITGKAKTAVQQSVNETVMEKIAEAIGKAITVLEANGVTADSVVTNMRDRIKELQTQLVNTSNMMYSMNAMLTSASAMTHYSSVALANTAKNVSSAKVSTNQTVDKITSTDTQAVQDQAQNTYDKINSSDTNSTSADTSSNTTDTTADTSANTSTDSGTDTSSASDNGTSIDQQSGTQTASSAAAAALTPDEALTQLNDAITELDSLVTALSDDVNNMNTQITAASEAMTASPMTASAALAAESGGTDTGSASVPASGASVSSIIDSINQTNSTSDQVTQDAIDKISPTLDAAITAIETAAPAVNNMMDSIISTCTTMSASLEDISARLGSAAGTVANLRNTLLTINDQLTEIIEVLDTLEESSYLQNLSDALKNNADELGSFFASPITMETDVLYPIDNYGSAMAPFYTVLAQWVGALFCICLLKVQIRSNDLPSDLSVPERFFGRFGVYLACAMIQAIVVALGDLLYVGIYCVHPILFIMACMITGLCFIMINYALAFSLENIGLGASVIIMVLQVAGSGGSYPIQVVPKIFQVLYPYMPFNYAMNAIREAIAGTYGLYYLKDIGILLLMTLLFLVIGQLLYNPAHWLNELIRKSKEKSEVMIP